VHPIGLMAAMATTGGSHDHWPLCSRSRHHGRREPISRLAIPGRSQISGRRVLRVIGHPALSLSRDVSVPLLGTGFVETPQISGGRSIVHFILFLLCLHYGFISKPKT
jgi:hypothetical protein